MYPGKYKVFIRMAFIAILISFFTLKSTAQLNESDIASFQLRTAVNGIKQGGNVNLDIIRLKLEVVSKIASHFTVKSQNSSLYQEFNGLKADNDLNSRNYLYLNPQNRIYPFAIAFIQTNYRLKINYRFFTGPGMTYQVIQKRNHSLKLSGSLVYEETRFATNIFNESSYNNQHLISIWRPTLYVSGYHKLNDKKINLHYSLYWQSGISIVKNQRFLFETGLDIKVWKGMSIMGQYLLTFEQVVPDKIIQNDDILTFGISYEFAKINNQ